MKKGSKTSNRSKSLSAKTKSKKLYEGEILHGDSEGNRPARGWWETSLWFVFANDWRQLLFAASLMLAIAVAKWFDAGSYNISPFKTYSELHSFVFGISSIVTLIASITFGFLIYTSQAVESEKRELYSHLRSSVRQARKVLDPLAEEGMIGSNVSDKMYAFELIMPSDLPLRTQDWEAVREIVDKNI